MKLAAASLAASIALLTACGSNGASSGGVVPQAQRFIATAQTGSHLRLTGHYPIPSFGPIGVFGITAGPGHLLWFTEFEGNAIGTITTAGTLNSYSTVSNAQPNGIAVGRAPSRIWTGGYGGELITSTVAGVQTDYPIANAHIGALVLGHDRNIWFTDYGNDAIGYVTSLGAITEFPLPTGATPVDITVGSDGNFWVLDSGRNRVLKVSPAGSILRSYKKGLPSVGYLTNIVAAPDKNLYFTEDADNLADNDGVARITTAGKITQIGKLPPESNPNRLTVGKDKNIYFSIGSLQAVGEITLATGKVSYQFLPMTGEYGTNAITKGPDGRLWLGGNQNIFAISY